jgi:4'-phosphopantetheinyl transferase
MHYQIFDNEIHFRFLDLSESERFSDFFSKFISPSELKKSQKLCTEKLVSDSICSKALLRCLLSGYININPAKIEFTYNKYGKPYLKESQNTPNIFFNMSDSGGFVFYGISKDSEIGVDIEKIRPVISLERIAHRQLTQIELMIFQQLHENEKSGFFFKYWTMKESFLKAIGRGLSVPMNTIDVSGAPRKPVIYEKYLTIEKNILYTEEIYFNESFSCSFSSAKKPEKIELFKHTLKDFLGF